MLLCYMCHEWKPEADFAFQSIKTGKRQSHCRVCQAKYRRQHYLDNKESYVRREVARIEAFRKSNRVRLLEYLRTHPCVDCGERDPVVLEFDHRDPQAKRAEVSVLAARKPWPIVEAEIAKCDVRCANCHRIRTAEQFHWSLGNVPESLEPELEAARSGVIVFAETRTELRECSKCHEVKPLTEFSVKNKKTGRRARICKSCIAAASMAHYYQNRDIYLERSRQTKKKYRRQNRARKAGFIAGLSCVDCGETNPVVLEFDHRDTHMKRIEVSRLMSSGSRTELLAEIEKCDVRCANCHRRRTAQQFGYFRSTATLSESAATYAA